MAFETNWAYARVSARMRKCPGNFCDLACMPFESIILTMEKVGDAEYNSADDDILWVP
jgi:hypothetical protein